MSLKFVSANLDRTPWALNPGLPDLRACPVHVLAFALPSLRVSCEIAF